MADSPTVIITCPRCHQRLRLPRSRRRLRVTCPQCHSEFRYRYYAFGLSSRDLASLLISLAASLVGFVFFDPMLIARSLPVERHVALALVFFALGVAAWLIAAAYRQRAALYARLPAALLARLRHARPAIDQALYLIMVGGLLPIVFTCTVGFIYQIRGGGTYYATAPSQDARDYIDEMRIRWICSQVMGIWGVDLIRSDCEFGAVLDTVDRRVRYQPIDASLAAQLQLRPDYTWWESYGGWVLLGMPVASGVALALSFLLDELAKAAP